MLEQLTDTACQIYTDVKNYLIEECMFHTTNIFYLTFAYNDILSFKTTLVRYVWHTTRCTYLMSVT